MAKVTGPLYSVSASGKVADAIVFSQWKGRPTVRQWLIPKNKMSGAQGDQRLILGGTGRAFGVVKPTSDYEAQLITLGLIPADQSKQSYLVKRAIAAYLVDATAFEALYTAFEAHTAKADFTSAAAGVGLIGFDVTYKATTHSFSAGMMLYLVAKTAIGLAFTGAPYTTALATWTASEISAMVADLAPGA